MRLISADFQRAAERTAVTATHPLERAAARRRIGRCKLGLLVEPRAGRERLLRLARIGLDRARGHGRQRGEQREADQHRKRAQAGASRS